MNATKDYTNNNIIKNNSVIQLIKGFKQNTLENYYESLEYDIGCTYMFYIYEDILRDQKIIYTSNWEWQHRLIGEKLINECPIFKAGTAAHAAGRKSIILPWSHIHCKTSLEKDITLYRQEFNIANGMGISHTNGIIREGIGLGADIRDVGFVQRILANNFIYRILKKSRELAMQNITCPIIH